ncbi:hypothetical protein [Arthrobacter sp. U41]|uniref:hypothetical protein n=1 Tax=Arthrobacter sp. U41 TaxID=1849032 RepID=UPI0021B5993D|nr:hypothetical protein [Arthrobacter sp. U41]
MLGIDTSSARSKRLGGRLATGAATAVIASGGLVVFSAPAFAAESETCTAAQASYQAALTATGASNTLSAQVAAANQAVTEAQQARDALAAAAVADAVQAQADLDVAVASAAKTETGLESARERLQRALDTARWAADRVDRIQTELDELPELNAAAEEQARTQLEAATAAQSAAAVSVTAAQTALEAANASQDQPAIDAAQAALLAKQVVLEAAEAQLAAAKLALEGVKADGEAQLADAWNRVEAAEQLLWEMGDHLMQADDAFRAANDQADTAADGVTRAQATLLAAQNVEGIAAADAALATASAAAKALHAQTTTPPDPASIDRLFRTALEACAATSETVPKTPVAVATPVVAPVIATESRRAAVEVSSSAPAQQTGAANAANPGLNVQTGVITDAAAQAPASPQGQGGLPVAAWSLGGLVVLAAASFGVRRRSVRG